MTKHFKVVKVVALGVLGIAVLAIAGSALGGDGDAGGGVSGAGAVDSAAPDAVMAAVDKALGREAPPVAAPPAMQAARGAATDGTASNTVPAVKPATAEASGGAPATASSSVDDRKIVQTASLRLQVKEVGAGFEEVGRIATGAGGFVASSSFSYQGEQQVASVTVRVPAARYQDVLSQLRGLGVKVDAETSNASDVTEEYTDLSARIRNLEASETQLLQLLARANNVAEVLQVQDRLNNVRGEIERLKGRIALLDKLSDMATITVHLRPVAVPVKSDATGIDLGATVRSAWEDSLEFLGGIAEDVLTVLVFSWWLLPLALPAGIIAARWSRSRPASTPAVYD